MWYPHIRITKRAKSSSFHPSCFAAPQMHPRTSKGTRVACVLTGRESLAGKRSCLLPEERRALSETAESSVLPAGWDTPGRIAALGGALQPCMITPGSLLGATAHLLTAPVLPINIFITLACLPSRNLQGLSGSRKAIMGTVNFYACPL